MTEHTTCQYCGATVEIHKCAPTGCSGHIWAHGAATRSGFPAATCGGYYLSSHARLIAKAPELVEALRAFADASQTILASNWARGIAGEWTEAEGDALACLDESCEDAARLLAEIDG